MATNVTITFSEPVFFSSGSFSFTCNSVSVPFAVSGVNTAAATINPDSDLPTGANCSVTVIAANVNDLDGTPNNMAADYSFGFSTVAGVNNPPNIQDLSQLSVSAVIGDPTQPSYSGASGGFNFTVSDTETAADAISVSVSNGNPAVLSSATVVDTGVGTWRLDLGGPTGIGYSNVTITATDDGTGSGTSQSTQITFYYAASNGDPDIDGEIYPTGIADASAAVAIDSNFMIIANDEDQTLRVFSRTGSGPVVTSQDVTSNLNLTDLSGGNPREVDIEAAFRVGNRVYWLGSHSNSSSGNNRPNRSRLFAVDINGTGPATTQTFVGYYAGLKTDLIAWDSSNGHGLGANFFGLAASAATGVIPEASDGSGFNIEGFSSVPNNSTTAFVAFRAPIVPASNRTNALIVPVTNFQDLVAGNPAGGPATFGAPIQLDLGGRGIRDIKCSDALGCLILAGPAASSGGFALYTWTGNAGDAPILRSAVLASAANTINPEAIVEMPASFTPNAIVQLVSDNGDTIWYNDGIIAKDLPINAFKKFRVDTFALGTGDAAPNVTTTTPANTATNVAVDSTVTVNFSEFVNFAADSFTFACNSNPVAFSLSISPATSAVLTPDADLPNSANCSVIVIASNVTDVDSDDPPNTMASDYTFTFTIVAPTDTAPSVSNTNPSNAASDVPLNTTITVTFSESVNFAANSFTFTCNSNPVAFSLSSSPAIAATLTPDINLPIGANCSVTVVAANVTDVDSDDPPDTMTADVTFTFSTLTPANVADTIGVFRDISTIGYFLLRNSNDGGIADFIIPFGLGTDQAVVGDWNGDGVDTVGLYRQSAGLFILSNSNAPASADLFIQYGAPGDVAVVGDWDGNSTDTIAIYRAGVFMIRNSNDGGFPDIYIQLGDSSLDKPLSGDWNNDGTDTPGLWRASAATFYLTNQSSNGAASVDFAINYGTSADVGFVGDWDANGVDSLGVYRPSNGDVYLKNALTDGLPDILFNYGAAQDVPLAGVWQAAPPDNGSAPIFVPRP